ncbi:MAG: asparagine synthase-related protein [Alphaproteobacteria bacterium]
MSRSGSSSIYAQWHVFALAKENGVTVMLDGQGADGCWPVITPFSAHGLADLFRSLRWVTLAREARSFITAMHAHGHGSPRKSPIL